MSYIEREPLLKILNGLYEQHLTMHNYSADSATQDCIEAVINAPAAVVRCKNRKYYNVFRLECHHALCNGYMGVDDFCSHGERRE